MIHGGHHRIMDCAMYHDSIRLMTNVVITSKRRHFDVITSKWRRFDVIMTSLLRHVSVECTYLTQCEPSRSVLQSRGLVGGCAKPL